MLFVGFTAEETGLRGSESFLGDLSEDNRSKIQAAVNIDSLGLSSTKVWFSRSDADLVRHFFAVARAMKLPAVGVNVEKVGSSDGQSFRRRKIPSLDVHSITQETRRILHSPWDGLPEVHMDDYYESYQLLAGYLAYLDNKLE